MKIYITKYWQTHGVWQVDGEPSTNTPSMCTYMMGGYKQLVHGQDWHTDIDAAKERFESQRLKKIKAMQAKINKLNAMKFEVFIK